MRCVGRKGGRAINGGVANGVVRALRCGRRLRLHSVRGDDCGRHDIRRWLDSDGDFLDRGLGHSDAGHALSLRKSEARKGQHGNEGLHLSLRCCFERADCFLELYSGGDKEPVDASSKRTSVLRKRTRGEETINTVFNEWMRIDRFGVKTDTKNGSTALRPAKG